VTIQHRNGSYPVHFIDRSRLLTELPPSSYIITDANVRAAFADEMPDLPTLVLPPGEASKSLETFGRCLEWLMANGASRSSHVVALGGGVIGDLGGFAAASYMRGVQYIQIPTTLLSQVDSSVGGKVGVDLPGGKNMAGAFHPPVEVRIATEVLRQLPQRQFDNGMAEVWKYGAIMDRALFNTLLADTPNPEHPNLQSIVARCIELKAEVVEKDEFETNGIRATLNFGHTVAHAVELLTGFGPVLHGEAVAFGMVVEARLGERIGLTPPGTERVLIEAMRAQNLPIGHSVVHEGESMLRAMRRDKKAVRGQLAFSLLTDIGGCKLVKDVSETEVLAALSSP